MPITLAKPLAVSGGTFSISYSWDKFYTDTTILSGDGRIYCDAMLLESIIGFSTSTIVSPAAISHGVIMSSDGGIRPIENSAIRRYPEIPSGSIEIIRRGGVVYYLTGGKVIYRSNSALSGDVKLSIAQYTSGAVVYGAGIESGSFIDEVSVISVSYAADENLTDNGDIIGSIEAVAPMPLIGGTIGTQAVDIHATLTSDFFKLSGRNVIHASLLSSFPSMSGSGRFRKSNGAALFSDFMSLSGVGSTGAKLKSMFPLLSGSGVATKKVSAQLVSFFPALYGSGSSIKNDRANGGVFFTRLSGIGKTGAKITSSLFSLSCSGILHKKITSSLASTFIALSCSGTTKSNSAILESGFISFSAGNRAVLKSIFTRFSGGGVAGSDAIIVSAIVVNLRTGESSLYSNYSFNNIIRIDNKFYGVKYDGLYLLEGSSDNGDRINGRIVTSDTDFGTMHEKIVAAIYLNSDTITTIAPIVDGVKKNAQTSTSDGRKCNMARGNSGRYWQFAISAIKKLTSLEIISKTRQRRR